MNKYIIFIAMASSAIAQEDVVEKAAILSRQYQGVSDFLNRPARQEQTTPTAESVMMQEYYRKAFRCNPDPLPSLQSYWAK